MRKLIVFAFIGFLAQLIDGALGMAYGVTSSSLLLAFSIAPAIASASVHLSEVFTTIASSEGRAPFLSFKYLQEQTKNNSRIKVNLFINRDF